MDGEEKIPKQTPNRKDTEGVFLFIRAKTPGADCLVCCSYDHTKVRQGAAPPYSLSDEAIHLSRWSAGPR